MNLYPQQPSVQRRVSQGQILHQVSQQQIPISHHSPAFAKANVRSSNSPITNNNGSKSGTGSGLSTPEVFQSTKVSPKIIEDELKRNSDHANSNFAATKPNPRQALEENRPVGLLGAQGSMNNSPTVPSKTMENVIILRKYLAQSAKIRFLSFCEKLSVTSVPFNANSGPSTPSNTLSNWEAIVGNYFNSNLAVLKFAALNNNPSAKPHSYEFRYPIIAKFFRVLVNDGVSRIDLNFHDFKSLFSQNSLALHFSTSSQEVYLEATGEMVHRYQDSSIITINCTIKCRFSSLGSANDDNINGTNASLLSILANCSEENLRIDYMDIQSLSYTKSLDWNSLESIFDKLEKGKSKDKTNEPNYVDDDEDDDSDDDADDDDDDDRVVEEQSQESEKKLLDGPVQKIIKNSFKSLNAVGPFGLQGTSMRAIQMMDVMSILKPLMVFQVESKNGSPAKSFELFTQHLREKVENREKRTKNEFFKSDNDTISKKRKHEPEFDNANISPKSMFPASPTLDYNGQPVKKNYKR